MLRSLLTIIFLSALYSGAMATSSQTDYSGTYSLVAGHDADQNSIDIPEGKFVLTVTTETPSQYNFYIKIGNSLGTIVNVLGPSESAAKESIQVGLVRSTRMRSSPPLARLEHDLSNLLPQMKCITSLSNGNSILLEGEGDLMFASDEVLESTR